MNGSELLKFGTSRILKAKIILLLNYPLILRSQISHPLAHAAYSHRRSRASNSSEKYVSLAR